MKQALMIKTKLYLPPYFGLNFRLSVILFIGIICMNSPKAIAQQVTVQIDNLDITKSGNILVMLYSDKGFPKDHQQALAIKVLPASEQQLLIDFSAVPETFAIKILHDEDESGEVSKNWTGIIPAEGLGFSNGAKLFFGPPNFNKAKLVLSAISQPIKISIIYP